MPSNHTTPPPPTSELHLRLKDPPYECDINTTKYTTLFHHIHNLSIREIRETYRGLRQSRSNTSVDAFFPALGFTAGEFATAQILKNPKRLS